MTPRQRRRSIDLVPCATRTTGPRSADCPQSAAADVDAHPRRAPALGAQLSRGTCRASRATRSSTARPHCFDERAETAATLIVREAGKTIRQARKEVRRAITTLSLSAEAARSNTGEVIPFDAFEGSENRRGWFTREPLGVILAITPYNDALNLVAHKLGPAIAGGNSVILKPSQSTPLTAQLPRRPAASTPACPTRSSPSCTAIAMSRRRCRRARRPDGLVHRGLRHRRGDRARPPGSSASRWSSAATHPCSSSTTPTSPRPSRPACRARSGLPARTASGRSGSSCSARCTTSSATRFVAAAAALRAGDPADESTDVGPMISESAARTRRAPRRGRRRRRRARCCCGHRRDGSVFWPDRRSRRAALVRAWADEVFAPVVDARAVRHRGRGDRAGERRRVRAARGRVHARPQSRACGSPRPRRPAAS